jgi:hypothetical protein
MHPIPKVFFFSLVVLVFYLLLTPRPRSNSDLKALRAAHTDSIPIRSFDENLDRYDKWLARGKLARQKVAPVFDSGQAPSTLQQQNVINALIDDFLVNDDPIGANDQVVPAGAQDPAGNFIITWQDDRNGNYDIYAQRYNSAGITLGSNFKVNDDTGTAGQFYPDIAVCGSGDFIITWYDQRNGNYDIYAQRYDSSGTLLGSNFKVNDDMKSASQAVPAIASDSEGCFVIVWQDYRSGHWDIYAQRYNSSGTPLDANSKVNDDAGTTVQGAPDIAMDGSGNFIIAWHDDRDGSFDIYAQRYNSAGTPLSSNFKVNDDAGTSDQGHPTIFADGFGNFILTWDDGRGGNRDIHAQRYDSSGTPLGANFKVNDDSGTATQDYPAIAADGTGNFIITWHDERNENEDIYAQRCDSSGTPLGANFKVNDDPGTTYQRNPAIALDGSGNFFITWQDWRNGIHWDVYVQRYDLSGTPLAFNFRVNDDIGYAVQQYPDVALDDDGNLVITWKDHRFSDYGDIFAQRFSSSGISLGSNFKVNDGMPGVWYPAVTSHSSGSFVITWEDSREYNWDIFAQRYDSSGTPLDTNFKVSEDPTGSFYQVSPAIGIASSGKFVVTWADDREGNDDVYAQRYTSSGTPYYFNFRVNNEWNQSQRCPAIAFDGSGNFVITWVDRRNGMYDIYAQRYNAWGYTLGSNFKVNDVSAVIIAEEWWVPPAVAMDGSGNFIITWYDERNGPYNFDIYAQRFNSQGYPLGSNFKVNDDPVPAYQGTPDIASDGRDKFIITWSDYRNGNWDIYAQKYDSSGTPLGSNHLVPNPGYASFAQVLPAVAANESRICFTWMDDRRGEEWDIYAKVVDWCWPSIYGDVNGDGVINSADVVYLINYLFKGGPEPSPLETGDVNCDGTINSADVVYLINYLFKGGPTPAC